jgi:hypothetical protein
VLGVDVDVEEVKGVVADLSQNPGRIDFSAIANALTSEWRKRHIEEGLCF